MSPKLDKSFHQPYYKEPEPIQKHPPHLRLPDEIKLVPPPPGIKPPHQPYKKKKGLLMMSLIIGTIITIIIGLILNYYKISVNVILPVLAPIWVCSITLIYTINKD